MTNEEIFFPFLKKLWDKVIAEDFVIDKSGVKLVELIAPSFTLDPNSRYLTFNGRSTPKKYVDIELTWYDSMRLDSDYIGQHAQIWKDIAGDDGSLNSNYGYLVYSKENYSQYDNVLQSLIKNAGSRQAIMIYNRPSMHYDSVENGKRDFVCTLAHQFFIRNNKLHSVVNMRSNDAIYGFFNDFAWFCTVHERLYIDLLNEYPDLQMGEITHIANSFHVYERHFPMLQKIISNSPFNRSMNDRDIL
jgi:thymidylate synthase